MSESRHHLSKYIAVFAGGTMFSRVTGLMRDVVMGWFIPKEPLAAFNIAFRFPNMLRDLVGEGASNAAFIPVLSETLEKESKEAFQHAVSAILSAMILVLGAIAILGVIFMPAIFRLLQPISHFTGVEKLSPEYVALLSPLTRWCFPYIFFIGLTVFQMGPLFIMRHYSTPSWAPALLNVAQVCMCLLWQYRHHTFSDPAYALVVGVWIGGASQLLVQYLAVGKHVGVWRPNFHLRDPHIRASFWLLMPVVLGQSAGEVNKLVDTMFGASMGPDVVNAFYYSNRLIQLPLSVFGIAISSAILPSISRAATRGEFSDIRETLMQGLRQCYFFICPTIVTFLVMPGPIVALLFQRGEFKPINTSLTAVALAYFSLGLLCFAWVKIAVAGFYAVQDTRTPVKIAVGSVILNIALILILSRPMGYRGLALATTLSYSANFLALFTLLCRRYGRLWDRALLSALGRVTLASVMMGVILFYAYNGIERFFPVSSLFSRVTCVGYALATGAVAYAAFCAILRVPDVKVFASVLKRAK